MTEHACFRPARADEASLVRAISAEAYEPAYRAIGVVPKPAFEDYAPRITAGQVWLAFRAGEAAGVLVLEAAPDHLLVYSVAVRPRHQGSGLGRALLALAEARAAADGWPELRLYTNRRMTRNLALYVAAGYRRTGERPHPTRPGEVLVDLAKPMTPSGLAAAQAGPVASRSWRRPGACSSAASR